MTKYVAGLLKLPFIVMSLLSMGIIIFSLTAVIDLVELISNLIKKN
jgi:hypothetical protein